MNFYGTVKTGCETMRLDAGDYINVFGLYYNANQGITSVEFTSAEGNFRTRGVRLGNDYYIKFQFTQFKPLIGLWGTSSYVPSSIGLISYDS